VSLPEVKAILEEVFGEVFIVSDRQVNLQEMSRVSSSNSSNNNGSENDDDK